MTHASQQHRHAVDAALVEADLRRSVHREVSARDVIDLLAAHGVRVYIVGGAPRDWLAGESARDIDLSIDHDLDDAHALLRRAFPDGDPVIRKYASFGTMRWGDPEREPLDINILRDYRQFAAEPLWQTVFIAGRSVADDSLTRDFSINAMYFDCQDGVVLDPTGDGLADLRGRVLRLAADPCVRRTDFRTSLRIAQFIGRGYTPTPATAKYLDEHIDRDIAGVANWLNIWLVDHGFADPARQAWLRELLAPRIGASAREILERGLAAAAA